MPNEQTQIVITPDTSVVPNTPQVAARPEYIEEKFWDADKGVIRADELAKSYKELQTAFSSRSPQAPQSTSLAPQVPSGDPKATTEAAGLDWTAVQNKVAQTGTIEEADFAAFEKIGVPKTIVAGVIEQGKRLAEANNQLAVLHVGGEEQMNALMGWAKDSLSDTQKTEYNTKLAGPNWREALNDLRDLHVARSKTAGEPTFVGASGRPGGAQPVGYANREEQMKDMKDPRYWTDASFRQAVAEKIAATQR